MSERMTGKGSKKTFNYWIDKYNFTGPALMWPVESFANIYSPFSSDNRDYIFSVFGYEETSIILDENREIIRRKLREKNSMIQLDEGLAYLRLCVLVTMFDHEFIYKSPDNDKDFREFCLNHPLWPRIEKQAQKTLELFKKNKYKREVPI